VFVHESVLRQAGLYELRDGNAVEFLERVGRGSGKLQACFVRLLTDSEAASVPGLKLRPRGTGWVDNPSLSAFSIRASTDGVQSVAPCTEELAFANDRDAICYIVAVNLGRRSSRPWAARHNGRELARDIWQQRRSSGKRQAQRARR
jgi:hypothetical protein